MLPKLLWGRSSLYAVLTAELPRLFSSSASFEIATICVSVKRLRLIVVFLQGDPARNFQLQHVSHEGKLTEAFRSFLIMSFAFS